MKQEDQLVEKLAAKAIEITRTKGNVLEQSCWMVIHQYCHGTMPFEYDIRDIDEALYLKVLNFAKNTSS